MMLFSKLNTAVVRTVAFSSLLFELFDFFKVRANVEVLKLSFCMFFSKYVNMFVMFIPIKLLFILSGSKNIGPLEDIELYLGRNTYVALLLFIVTFLYFFDMGVKIYTGKLINHQKQVVPKADLEFQNKNIKRNITLRTYKPYCQIISDFMVIFASTCLFVLLSPVYALFYIFVIIFYFLSLEYLLFSPHQTRLLKKLNLDNNQFIQVCNGILYLIFFLGIVVVLFVKSTHILVAILILLVARISTTSLRTVFTSQKALRRDFFVNT